MGAQPPLTEVAKPVLPEQVYRLQWSAHTFSTVLTEPFQVTRLEQACQIVPGVERVVGVGISTKHVLCGEVCQIHGHRVALEPFVQPPGCIDSFTRR